MGEGMNRIGRGFIELLGRVRVTPVSSRDGGSALVAFDSAEPRRSSGDTHPPVSIGVGKGGGGLAADNRGSLVDELVLRKGLYHE